MKQVLTNSRTPREHKEILEVNDGSKLGTQNNKEEQIDKNLCFIPIAASDDGNDVIIFDVELAQLGSSKWDLTICGYFVGAKMSYNELRCNLVRMRSSSHEVFCFKFKHEHGMKFVIENSPWLVGVNKGRIGYARVLVGVEVVKLNGTAI
ncbi:hypothetical protein Tco_0253007 [Tanacetum coccineum]